MKGGYFYISNQQNIRNSRERNIMGIKTTIVDVLGYKTGISIDSVRVLYDKHPDEDWIRITGRLAATEKTYTSFEYEPDLIAEVINKADQVCISATSHHHGCFAASKQIPFSIEIKNVSEHIQWEDIHEINMYLYFHRRKTK